MTQANDGRATYDTEFYEVITKNQDAQQGINNDYFKQAGSVNLRSVINWFIGGTLMFQILSVIFSTFGFYFDFNDRLGIGGALAIGLSLALFIEISRHKAIEGMFNGSVKQVYNRMIFFGLAVILTVIAVGFHFRSLDNYTNYNVNKDLQKQVDYERKHELLKQNNIEGIIASNAELVKALNNGTTADDQASSVAVVSNNKLAEQLASMKGEASTAAMLLNHSIQSNKQNSNTLLIMFLAVEFFACFGVIGKFIQYTEVDDVAKESVTLMDEIAGMKTYMFTAIKSTVFNNMKNEFSSHVASMRSNKQIGSNTGYNNEAHNSDECKNIASLPYSIDNVGKSTYVIEDTIVCEEEKKEKPTTKKEEIPIIDLSKFDDKERRVIQVMFENGVVKYGDRLIPKSHVKTHFKKDRLITRKFVDEVYELLEESYGYIEHKGGFIAKANIENVVVAKSA